MNSLYHFYISFIYIVVKKYFLLKFVSQVTKSLDMAEILFNVHICDYRRWKWRNTKNSRRRRSRHPSPSTWASSVTPNKFRRRNASLGTIDVGGKHSKLYHHYLTGTIFLHKIAKIERCFVTDYTMRAFLLIIFVTFDYF